MTAADRINSLKDLFKNEKKKKENGGFSKSREIYPFWTMQDEQKAVVRFLPDANKENPFLFYIEKLDHTLPINGKNTKIPCLTQYGEDCPICELSRKYYKQEGKESKNGKFYYRDKTSIARVLVLQDPLPADEETGETFKGKVCITQLGYQIMQKIKADIVNIPDDEDFDFLSYDNGYNFTIYKTASGKYGKYDVASTFDRRPSAIPAEYREACEDLVDLSTLLPANPGYDKVHAMLSCHINGEDYVEDGKPAEESNTSKSSNTETRASASSQAHVDENEKDDSTDGSEDNSTEDLLAAIRRRVQSK